MFLNAYLIKFNQLEMFFAVRPVRGGTRAQKSTVPVLLRPISFTLSIEHFCIVVTCFRCEREVLRERGPNGRADSMEGGFYERSKPRVQRSPTKGGVAAGISIKGTV